MDEPTTTIEIPATLREDLETYAASHNTDLETLVRAWLQDRLVHEDEKERGVARKVKP